MSDRDTPSQIFRLRTRHFGDMEYEDRDVNMEFEKTHIELFKIVPPTIGSFIYLEWKYQVDAIAYQKGKIILCMTKI